MKIDPELRKVIAEMACDPMAKVRHHFAVRYPAIPFNSHRLRDALIADFGQSAATIDDLRIDEIADMLAGTARHPLPRPTIPAERRTKPMTKKKAMRLAGWQGNEKAGVRWLSECIKDGERQCDPVPRSGLFYFSLDDDWPPGAVDKLK